MDENSIDRIRSATFTIARRGYETREVERFLGKIADWLETGGEDEARADMVRRELERVGQRTAGILATASESAEQLRAEAQDEAEATIESARVDAARTREDADAHSAKTRKAADAYSSKLRAEAGKQANAVVAEADAKAERIVEDGIRRRGEIEVVIADLVERRDSLIAEVNRLAQELRAVAGRHAPVDGKDPFDVPGELDPQERVKA